MLDTKLLGKYARIYLARKKIRAMDRKLTDKLLEMEQPLIDHMQDQGDDNIDKISLKGGRTLTIDRKVWVKALTSDKHKIVAGLRQCGLDHLVTEEGYNSISLSKYLRTLEQNDEQLPPELETLIAPNPTYKLIVRRR